MNYTAITNYDINNGPKFRVSLWVSGCSIRCPECHNSELWNFNLGREFTDKTISEILTLLKDPNIDGLTILGGEPLDQDYTGILDLIELCMAVKFDLKKSIWLYTGYVIKDILKDNALLKYCDVIVDGPYIKELRDTSLAFRGSKNQRIINVNESLKQQKIVEINEIVFNN